MTIEWEAGRLDSELDGVGSTPWPARWSAPYAGSRAWRAAVLHVQLRVPQRRRCGRAFAGDVPGNVYSRYTNPTVRAFEERIAALEGAEQAVATASGMAAILATVMSLCSAGDHVLVSRSVFGATVSLFEKYFKRFGVQVDYVPLTDFAAWESAFKENTKLVFVESPSNPLAELVDIAALAHLCHGKGAMLAVDNCFCTPVRSSR